MRSRGFGLLLAAALAAGAGGPTGAEFLLPAPGATLPAELATALDRLRASGLKRGIARLADPALEGRGLGSRGLEQAGRMVAEDLAEAGLAPFGERRWLRRGWFQKVPLREVQDASGRITFRASGQTIPGLATLEGATLVLPRLAPGRITLPLVDLGHGLREPGLGHDDLRGRDLRGKAVLLRGGLPAGPAWRTEPYASRHAPADPEDRYDARLAALEAAGAALVLALEPEGPVAAATGPTYFLQAPAAPPPELPPLVRVSPAVARTLAGALEGRAELSVELEIAGTARTTVCRNVLGFLEGADPALRREAVVLGAHLDHLGRPGGVVHPGADDNASGVAALLELARAFAAGPRPRRSLVFAFWTGEETGKFGSRHYVRAPAWPLERTVAYLNLDMIGHPWTAAELEKLVRESGVPDPQGLLGRIAVADFIEPGVAAGAPWLGPLLARAGGGLGLPLHLDWTDGRHGGSDYQPFARAGVPFVRFFGNYFPDYHRPGDTAERIDPAQVLKMARLAMATTWLLANP